MRLVACLILLVSLQAPLRVLAAKPNSNSCLPDWKVVFGKAFDYVNAKNLGALNLLLAKHGGCIRSQIRQRCPKPFDVSGGRDLSHVDCLIDETFMRLFSFSRRLKCSDALCSNPSTVNWETSKSKALRGGILMWFGIVPLQTGRKVSAKEVSEIVSALMKNIYVFLQKNDFGGLKNYLGMMRLPNIRQMNGLKFKCSSAATYNWESDLACSWNKFQKELLLLMSVYDSNDDKVKYLTTTFDHNEKLRQVQLKNIVDTAAAGTKKSLEQFTNELTSVINDRFEQLGDYFSTLAEFDGDIAKADIGYIVAALEKFSEKRRKLSSKFEELSERLLVTTTTLAAVNAAAAMLKAALTATLAAASAATGDFGGLVDTMDKMNEAADATLNVVKTARVAIFIKSVKKDMSKITKGLKTNAKLLENAKNIVLWESGKGSADPALMEKIRYEFLQAYNDYDPQVNSADIARINEGMENILNVIKESLEGVTETGSIVIAAGKTAIIASGDIEAMASVIPQIIALMESQFEYQFDYMDSLAAYLRAKLAQSSVQQLQASIEKSRKSGSAMSKNIANNEAALTALITAKTHTLQAVTQACNVIQYRNAGEMPTVCKKARKSLSDSDIADVIAFLPESCVENTNDGFYVSIPVSNGEPKPGTINLQDLYSKKQATFQIPDSQWLVDHGWMLRSDAAEKVFYVKGFELFLLSLEKTSQGRQVGVDISAGLSAPLMKGQQKFDIKPKQKFEFTYRENIPPCDKKDANPYQLCENKPLSEICVVKDGVIENELDLYPSIFSKWIIELPDLGSYTKIPTILSGEEKFYLQGKIVLCSKTPKTMSRVKVNPKPRASPAARKARCGEGNYFDRNVSQWRKCPSGSIATLGGYYCRPKGNFFFVH